MHGQIFQDFTVSVSSHGRGPLTWSQSSMFIALDFSYSVSRVTSPGFFISMPSFSSCSRFTFSCRKYLNLNGFKWVGNLLDVCTELTLRKNSYFYLICENSFKPKEPPTINTRNGTPYLKNRRDKNMLICTFILYCIIFGFYLTIFAIRVADAVR